MMDFLWRVAERVLGQAVVVEPVIAPLYGSGAEISIPGSTANDPSAESLATEYEQAIETASPVALPATTSPVKTYSKMNPNEPETHSTQTEYSSSTRKEGWMKPDRVAQEADSSQLPAPPGTEDVALFESKERLAISPRTQSRDVDNPAPPLTGPKRGESSQMQESSLPETHEVSHSEARSASLPDAHAPETLVKPSKPEPTARREVSLFVRESDEESPSDASQSARPVRESMEPMSRRAKEQRNTIIEEPKNRRAEGQERRRENEQTNRRAGEQRTRISSEQKSKDVIEESATPLRSPALSALRHRRDPATEEETSAQNSFSQPVEKRSVIRPVEIKAANKQAGVQKQIDINITERQQRSTQQSHTDSADPVSGGHPEREHSGLPSRATAESRESSMQSAPVIKVTIGRIEVRAASQPLPQAQETALPAPRMSLDDYLKSMSGGRR